MIGSETERISRMSRMTVNCSITLQSLYYNKLKVREKTQGINAAIFLSGAPRAQIQVPVLYRAGVRLLCIRKYTL